MFLHRTGESDLNIKKAVLVLSFSLNHHLFPFSAHTKQSFRFYIRSHLTDFTDFVTLSINIYSTRPALL